MDSIFHMNLLWISNKQQRWVGKKLENHNYRKFLFCMEIQSFIFMWAYIKIFICRKNIPKISGFPYGRIVRKYKNNKISITFYLDNCVLHHFNDILMEIKWCA